MTPSETTISAIRFGYGFHPDQRPPQGVDDLLRQVRRPDAMDLSGPSIRQRYEVFNAFLTARKAKALLTPHRQTIRKLVNADLTARILAPVASSSGFYERLATFWSDHFTVAMRGQATRVVVGRHEADAIRPYIAGNFRDMLRAAVTHPAMLIFLNQTQSVGPNSDVGKRTGRGLNENLAREILELHTLGVGAPYAQTDIRQFARLLTGLRVKRKTGEATFTRRAAEPGAKTVLGRRYGAGGHDLNTIHEALDAIARHPATARHIARKLAVHFVADTPPESLIAAMERAFQEQDGALLPVYKAMLSHPASWDLFGSKVKQPFDFIVSSLRASGGERAKIWKRQKGLEAVRALRRMNQPLLSAPGPDGWPEAPREWINAQGLTVRLGWASDLARAMGRRADPQAFLSLALADAAQPETTFAATNAAEKWEGIALTLASPEFNRR